MPNPSQIEDLASEALGIAFRGDDLVIYGNIPLEIQNIPHQKNEKEMFTRFYPRDYFIILEQLELAKIPFQSKINTNWELPSNITPFPKFKLYPFQKKAVEAWINDGKGRGIIIIPTGGGKTHVAMDLISKVKTNTLIVVPTLVLFEQWKQKLQDYLNISEVNIGFYGGGKKEILPFTIITYDSAHLYSKRIRDKFGFLILDEAHHLSGISYQKIADGYLAKYRLALTATLSSNDIAYNVLLNKGFGKIVFETHPSDLQDNGVISKYKIETIKIEAKATKEYKKQISIFQKYIIDKRLKGKQVFQQIIYRVNQDPKADTALKGYRKAREIAFAADEKLKALEKILKTHDSDKILIFSDIVAFCEKIARTFLIPCITNRTNSKERTTILEWYHRTPNAKLISSRILDEGVDIPDAKIGVILAGSGQTRQFIQRLGRILRLHPEKKYAKLYEIVSIDTMEEKVAKKRKRNV